MSKGVLLPPGNLRTHRLRAGHVLSGRFRDLHVVPAGVVRQTELEQHVVVERWRVRRGNVGCNGRLFLVRVQCCTKNGPHVYICNIPWDILGRVVLIRNNYGFRLNGSGDERKANG